MRNKPLLLTLILCFLLLLPLSACSERKIEEIKLVTNSFATEYRADAPLNTDGAFITVYYNDDNTERIPVTQDMVKGFDTSVTGRKTLTVTYKDMTVTHDYTVYNPDDASLPIVTSARFSISAYTPQSGEYTEYTVYFKKGDFGEFSACSFSLTSSTSLEINADRSNLNVSSEGINAAFESMLSSDGQALKIVLFNEKGDTLMREDGIIAKIKVTGGGNHAVSIKNITLSGGSGNYYLPPAGTV